MSLPLSIILPNYNHAQVLPCAIQSVLSQSFSDFELVIVDDGSTDGSVDVIQSYLKKDKRVRLLRHANNRGIAAAYATGVPEASGVYLQQFSATDYYASGFLEKSLHMLQKYPQIGICCTDAGLFIDDPQEFTSFPLIKNAPGPLIFPPSKIQQVFKYAHLSIPGLTSIVRREAFLKYGGYQNRLHFMSDWFLTLQISLFEGAIYIPETLTLFREPGYSKTTSLNPHIRKEALQHLIAILLKEQNRELLRRMRTAATLGLLCKERVVDVLKCPRLWMCYYHLVERYIYKHLRKLLEKPLVSADFLRRHSL